jgi:hypothetical protein
MDACLARLLHPAMKGGHLAAAQDLFDLIGVQAADVDATESNS